MTIQPSLLLSLTLSGLFACTAVDAGSDNCDLGKCDDSSQSSIGKLMPRAPSTPGAISVTRNQDNWLFEVIGSKGEIVLLSEEYNDRAAALNGRLSVEENGVLMERYELLEDAGSWHFVLRAGNGQVLAESISYSGEAEAEEGIEDARKLLAGIVQYRAAINRGASFDLDKDGSRWQFQLGDETGASVMQSQLYTGRTDALTGIASVRKNGKILSRYQLLDGPPRFILKARNGEEIAASPSFANLEEAESAMQETLDLLTSERVANPW